MSSNLRDRLLDDQEADATDLVELCSSLVKIPSDNPPGDTSKLASFIQGYLESRGLAVETYEPLDGVVNVVSSIGEGSPHLVLNGHLDQFPGEVGEEWSRSPYSGDVVGGELHGRGSGDMKGGLASLLHCFGKLSTLSIPGKVTFTGTSDEETGGRWGARWLLDNVEGLHGDAVLNGEPSGLTVRIGEKGRVPLILRARGQAAHGSFAGYVGDNAIMKMVRALPRVEALQGTPAPLDAEALSLTEEVMKGYKEQYGHESSTMADVLKHVTVNVGVIRGGAKDNIVPALCEAEVDVRLPLGIGPEEIRSRVEDEVHRVDQGIEVEWGRHTSTLTESTYTPPDAGIVKLLQANHAEATGREPYLSFTSGGTDCRFWRLLGVPAVSYGPKVYGMGGVDEHITVEDLATTARVHMATMIDFLAGRG
jgi:succinyl-diaminopimelate desuccinylase